MKLRRIERFFDYAVLGAAAALIVAMVWLVASVAIAQTDPLRVFPDVLVDAACTDDFDAGGLGTIANPQNTGSADGLCDGGTKILTGTLSSDTDLGPIGSVEYQNGYLRIDADTVSGATPTWRICLKVDEPWSADTWSRTVECSSTISGAGSGDDYIGLGPMFGSSEFDLADPVLQMLPKTFKVTLDLIDATGWAGSIGFIPARGSGGRPTRTVNPLSLADVSLTFTEHKVHQGKSFIADFDDDSMADAETIILVFKTMPEPIQVHLIIGFTTKVGGVLEMFEGATWTAQTGTELTITNRKRTGTPDSSGVLANQAQAGFVAADVINANPTGLNTGSATRVHHIIAWKPQGVGEVGGERDVTEIILKGDTQYAIRFTATGGTNAAEVFMDWYEHSDASE